MPQPGFFDLDERYAKTIWLFREQLTRHELHKTLFEHFDQQLISQGCRAQSPKGSDR